MLTAVYLIWLPVTCEGWMGGKMLWCFSWLAGGHYSSPVLLFPMSPQVSCWQSAVLACDLWLLGWECVIHHSEEGFDCQTCEGGFWFLFYLTYSSRVKCLAHRHNGSDQLKGHSQWGQNMQPLDYQPWTSNTPLQSLYKGKWIAECKK